MVSLAAMSTINNTSIGNIRCEQRRERPMSTSRRFTVALLVAILIAIGTPWSPAGDAPRGDQPGGDQQLFSAEAEPQGSRVTPDNLSVKPLSAVRSLPLEGSREGADEIRQLVLPVRHDVPQPSRPILTLRYWRLRKGTYDEFHRLSTEGLWPYFEKMGARMVGCWKVTIPDVGRDAGMLSHPEYDEAYMLVRYASFEHWQATRTWARLGGNGPDWEQARAAASARGPMVLDSWVTFLEGGLYEGGPFFTPALQEQYDLTATEGK
jgi:hypothetical protein